MDRIIALFQNKEKGLATIAIFITLVSFVGSKMGYTVSGIERGVSFENPGVFGVVEWIWEAVGFFLSMITFQIDGVPNEIALVFAMMGLLGIIYLVLIIRGN